jgi:hypothetical protein
VREEKMAAQKKQQEDRIKKSIERSKAPVIKKTVIPDPDLMPNLMSQISCRKPRGTTIKLDRRS